MPIQMSPLMSRALEDAQRELAGRFRGVFSEETISRVLDDSCQLIGARSTVGPNFMPIFVKKFGIDVRMEFPKPLTDEVVRAADVVITLGCGDACPIFPGKRYKDWAVADPADQPLEVVRRIRYDLHHHVTDLLESLNVAVNENT